MTTFVQNSSQTLVGNSYFDVHSGIARSGSMTDTQDHDWTFRIAEVRETQCVATPLMGRLSKLPEDDLDDLTQGLESLSLFGRTKAEVVLDPSLQFGSNIQFKEFAPWGDCQVPVVTLDDIKGSKVIMSPPSYDTEDSFSPGGPDPTMEFRSMEFGSLPLSHGVGMINELDLVHATLDILPERNEGKTEFEDQQRILTQLVNASPSTLHDHVIPSDTTPSPRTNSERQINDKTPRDVPTLHLTLQGIDTNSTPTYAPALPVFHSDIRSEQVAVPGGMTNPLLSQALLDYWTKVPSSSSVQYPFEQTPALADLPYPLESLAHPSQSISQNSQDLKSLFEQPIHDLAPRNPPADLEPQSYSQYDSSFSSLDWSIPPSLSPSYTDGSQDSTLYTPTSSRSPITPQSLIAAIPFRHTLPTQDILANISCVNPALLALNQVHFEESFPAFVAPEDNTRHRTIQRAAQVHELIMVQVAPYPIGPPTPKAKTTLNKGKGKAKAKPDGDVGDGVGDGVQARGQERQKKKKRDEADKVRCEIDGCNGTFFSNWELKRHQKNLHGIGEETSNMAVCPKCGRHFASRRKDSVDRHLELNACGKRNPRKSPKRFTTGQTS